MNAAYIKSQINSQERKLDVLQKDIAAYKKNLEEMKTAKTEFAQKKKQYENEFRVNSAYPQRILAMEALGLNGVKKIQAGIENAYSGTREKSLARSMEDTLLAMQKKISNEENKISACQQNITRVKETIASLKRELARVV